MRCAIVFFERLETWWFYKKSIVLYGTDMFWFPDTIKMMQPASWQPRLTPRGKPFVMAPLCKTQQFWERWQVRHGEPPINVAGRYWNNRFVSHWNPIWFVIVYHMCVLQKILQPGDRCHLTQPSSNDKRIWAASPTVLQARQGPFIWQW